MGCRSEEDGEEETEQEVGGGVLGAQDVRAHAGVRTTRLPMSDGRHTSEGGA